MKMDGNLLRFFRAGALGLGILVASAAGLHAQTNNNNGSANNTATVDRDDRRDDRRRDDDDRDWGWVGLLGLAGLLGLMPRRRVPVVVNEPRDDRDPRDRR
ncbi:MAG TPA: WGxxGxxG family protein [Pyrinomonadaceae bacterium]|nr:WGxxGxxG family protein [Pyrinomonadaceae bacterium]